ncbi:MAG TPA: helix-turn-helix domain-containing protein [Thermomicrobiales bacterium]|nr:helix-turn-helix domain-containing protein [Thermomicrobiales bacterium]
MHPAAVEREPATTPEQEQAAIGALDRLLEEPRADGAVAVEAPSTTTRGCAPGFRLVAPDGRQVDVPRSVVSLLHEMVHHLAHERAVSIVPLHKELTTQQAADLLNVSRPHLVSLLERGELPYTRPGKHRRVRFSDVMAYKRRREQVEKEALDELAQLSQDLGLYR